MKNENALPSLPPRRPREEKRYPVLSAQKITEMIENGCGDVTIAETHGNGRNKVFFLPEAYQEYKMIVSYGRRSPMNHSEKKFIGLGHFFVSEYGSTNIVVSHFIELLTTNRSPVSASSLGPNGEPNPGLDFLEYHREEYLRHEKQYNLDAYGCCVDPFLKLAGASEYVLEGHTHPDLGVFFSGPDRLNGAARAASSPVCIFVCDPVRGQMLGCVGKNFDNAQVIAYDRVPAQQAVQPEPASQNVELSRPEAPQQCFTTDDLVAMANNCLQRRGISGKIKSRTRLDGKVQLKIDLLIQNTRRRNRK